MNKKTREKCGFDLNVMMEEVADMYSAWEIGDRDYMIERMSSISNMLGVMLGRSYPYPGADEDPKSGPDTSAMRAAFDRNAILWLWALRNAAGMNSAKKETGQGGEPSENACPCGCEDDFFDDLFDEGEDVDASSAEIAVDVLEHGLIAHADMPYAEACATVDILECFMSGGMADKSQAHFTIVPGVVLVVTPSEFDDDA